jgi:acyl-coenzyme A thioesterase PaaI-like protein
MPSSTLFTDAMVLNSAGNGVYDGELNEHWTIGEKVHGGAMLALCANAARTELGQGQPIAVSGSFLWAPDPGPMRVVTTVRKRGRRVSLIDVELRQGDRTAVRAAVTLGEPEHHVASLSPRKMLGAQCTTVQIGQDWFDEDHIVVDCEGHIVVQSRQLAMVPQGS